MGASRSLILYHSTTGAEMTNRVEKGMKCGTVDMWVDSYAAAAMTSREKNWRGHCQTGASADSDHLVISYGR